MPISSDGAGPGAPPGGSDRSALDWLAARAAALDEAPLIAGLPDATVADDLAALGLSTAALRPLADLAAAPTVASERAAAHPAPHVPLRPTDRVAAPPHRTDRAARHEDRRREERRWRRSVVAAVGLFALVAVSLVAVRNVSDTATADRSADVKSGATGPALEPSRPTAATVEADVARLAALAASPADTSGAAAAISGVRRAHRDAADFEAIAGRPVDPSLASSRFAAVLAAAFDALGQPDSARAYRAR